MTRNLPSLVIYIALLSSSAVGNADSPPPDLELYLSPDQSFGLYKPPGWEVTTRHHPNGQTIVVLDPATQAVVIFTNIESHDPENDSVSWAASTFDKVQNQIPGLELASASSTRDGKRTVLNVRYQGATGSERNGRYYFLMDYPEARSFGYEASVDDLPRLRSTLVTVLGNLTYIKPSARVSARSSPETHVPALSLSKQWLSDGSASIDAPAGWNLMGEQGQAFCLNPESTMGFAFTISNFWGQSNIPYFTAPDMQGMIKHAYTQPTPAIGLVLQQLGASGMNVTGRWSNPQRAATAAAVLNRQMESETAFIEYLSREGVATRGYFDALTFAPMASGQWSLLFWAVWAPVDEFNSHAPGLVRIAESYQIDQQWAADYIRQGIENLKAEIAKTTTAVNEAADSIRQANTDYFDAYNRSEEYIDYKRTSWLRGEQEWISEAEGGELLKSDHWGLSKDGEYLVEDKSFNYYNFEGAPHGLLEVDASQAVYEWVKKQRE